MESQSEMDEIKEIRAEMQWLKGREMAGETSKELDARMAETLRRLNLLTEQKGKFASPISVVLSHSYRSHIFAHSLSTSPRHAFSVGQ